MIKIKVSYESQQELDKLVERLGQNVKSIKNPKQQKGTYKRAYIELKE